MVSLIVMTTIAVVTVVVTVAVLSVIGIRRRRAQLNVEVSVPLVFADDADFQTGIDAALDRAQDCRSPYPAGQTPASCTIPSDQVR